MYFRLSVALIASTLLSSPSVSQQTSSAAQAGPSAYFLGLREAYANAQPGIVSWVVDEQRQKLLDLYDERVPDPFIAAAPTWLAKCPVDAKVHLMFASLLAEKGRFAESIHHRNMFYGLLASIVASGDGKSPATGFSVISVDEEYTVLNYIGADLKSQRVVGHCDAMDVVIGEMRQTIYFDIIEHIKALKRALPSQPSK